MVVDGRRDRDQEVQDPSIANARHAMGHVMVHAACMERFNSQSALLNIYTRLRQENTAIA